ncbi:MAG: L,D-transpeptidase family protein [Thermodesulfobacteriota bacterium]|nr:L,D-transpeptidase family protein [Thermodesulfobacteriota bacterium]
MKMQESYFEVAGIKKILFATLVFLCSGLWSCSVAARLVPASLVKWHGEGAAYAVLVDKSEQKLLLYHQNDLSEPVKVYKCSSGENKGRKRRNNDKKTPEGVYFFTHSYDKRDLSAIYGVKAFPIDYPNPLDKKEGRGGYGIWFHGLDKPLRPRDTNGCVALENKNIADLASYIKLHKTPVIISPKIKMLPFEELIRESNYLQRLIERWRSSWEKKEIERYMDFYGPDFSSRWMNRNRWKANKTRLARKYEKIHVQVDNLQLFKTNGVVLARFRQTYRAGDFLSLGTKRLYLEKDSDQWKIIGEVFVEDEAGPGVLPKKPISVMSEIERLLVIWKKAWEEKDIATYIACYSLDFHSDGMDLEAWKSRKMRLKKKYGSIKVRVSNMKITQDSNKNAHVRFRQRYQADDYEDFGVKELLLVKTGRRWEILAESWSSL